MSMKLEIRNLCLRGKQNISLERSRPNIMSLSGFYWAPTQKYRHLNLDLSACLKAHNSASKGGTAMGLTVLESSRPRLSCDIIHTTRGKNKNGYFREFNHFIIRYLKSDYINV